MKVGDYVYCKENYPKYEDGNYPYRIKEKYLISRITEKYISIDGESIEGESNTYYFVFVKDGNRHYFNDVFYNQDEVRKIKLDSL